MFNPPLLEFPGREVLNVSIIRPGETKSRQALASAEFARVAYPPGEAIALSFPSLSAEDLPEGTIVSFEPPATNLTPLRDPKALSWWRRITAGRKAR